MKQEDKNGRGRPNLNALYREKGLYWKLGLVALCQLRLHNLSCRNQKMTFIIKEEET